MNCLKHGSYPNEGSCPVCSGLEFDFEAFMQEHAGLMKSLSESLMCPACNRVVKPPFANLGPDYHQAEGCMDCYVKIRGEE